MFASRCFLAFLLSTLGVSACGGSADAIQRVEWQGLVIEFKPICKDREIWLSGTIRNISSAAIRIENGVMPWDYDPVGTSFEAESSGQKLTRNLATPAIGRAGPIELQPQEQRSGETPIGFMFAEIPEQLNRNESITVHWVYWTRPRPDDAVSVKGKIVLSNNPCS